VDASIPGKELPYNGVYRLTPDGTLHLLVDDFALPNGLAFSPDESVLYVDDSAHKHIRALDVRPDGTLSNSRILLDMASEDPGVPDGFKVDVHGNVFCTGPGGVWVCRPKGNCWGALSCRSCPRTWPGARLGASSSLPRAPASTGYKRRRAAHYWSSQQACQAEVDNVQP
jgi:sugar lactone lactonase YvrE